jgi:hypothetical protein
MTTQTFKPWVPKPPSRTISFELDPSLKSVSIDELSKTPQIQQALEDLQKNLESMSPADYKSFCGQAINSINSGSKPMAHSGGSSTSSTMLNSDLWPIFMLGAAVKYLIIDPLINATLSIKNFLTQTLPQYIKKVGVTCTITIICILPQLNDDSCDIFGHVFDISETEFRYHTKNCYTNILAHYSKGHILHDFTETYLKLGFVIRKDKFWEHVYKAESDMKTFIKRTSDQNPQKVNNMSAIFIFNKDETNKDPHKVFLQVYFNGYKSDYMYFINDTNLMNIITNQSMGVKLGNPTAGSWKSTGGRVMTSDRITRTVWKNDNGDFAIRKMQMVQGNKKAHYQVIKLGKKSRQLAAKN